MSQRPGLETSGLCGSIRGRRLGAPGAIVCGAAFAAALVLAGPAHAQSITIGGKQYAVERLGGVENPGGSNDVGDFTQPVYITQPAGDLNNLFVVERVDAGGTGRIVRYDQSTQTQSTFLDISGGVEQDGGLQTMAFHPDFQSNGRFYLTTVFGGGTNVVDEYVANPANLNEAPVFSQRLLEYQDLSNGVQHTINWIGFRPNGASHQLYVTTGDGGTQADNPSFNPALIESTDTPYGKLLRLNVDGDYSSGPTGSGLDSDSRVEIVAHGLRNPYRASFDPTGGLFMGNVGFNTAEEIEYLSADMIDAFNADPDKTPYNYGWPQREGTAETNPAQGSGEVSDIDPIFDYAHAGLAGDLSHPTPVDDEGNPLVGNSVTGGYWFDGRYFFGEFVPDKLYSGVFDLDTAAEDFDGTNLTDIEAHLLDLEGALSDGLQSVVSFGTDNQGNLYIIDFGQGNLFNPDAGTGEIFRILAPVPVPEPGTASLAMLASAGLLMRRRRA